MRNHILNLVLFALVITIIGCGSGGSGGGGEKQDITVSLSPKAISVAGDATQQFTATILNPNNRGVTWTLSGSGCSGSACGTLGSYGGNNNQGWTATYTAPLTVPNPATVTVKATSIDDPSKSDTATITITAPVVTVSVTPATPTVILGATQQFTATVKGTTNTAVTWSTAGPGTINSSGLYSTPATVTTPKTVTVTATSQADTTKSGSATLTIPAVTVAVLPHVSTVILGASQQFTATVTNATNTAVDWSLSGAGSLSNTGLYAAPASLTTPATVTVRAVSQADPDKTMSITFTIPAVAVSVSPANPTVILGATQQFSAVVANAMNTAVTWTMTGPGSVSNAGLYAAPASLTTPATATITATSVADPSKSGSATVSIPAVAVSVTPPTATLFGGATQQFTAAVTNATNQAVTWSVMGPGSTNSSGLYSAPAVIASQGTVTVKATSVADPTKSGTATVTLIPISVTVSPATAKVVITGKKQFSAAVAGTSNTVVTWSVSGTGCSGDDCGTINSVGHYVAPAVVPSSLVTVKASSVADPTKSGTTSVQIMPNGNFKLNGNYVLYFQGFDPTGNMVASVASLVADGSVTPGTMTGVYDRNGVSTTPGAYTMTGNFTVWPDNRGVFTKNTGEVFRFAINDTGDRGYFIEWDNSGVRGSGIFKKQTTTDFSLAKITGDYAFGLTGSGNTGEREAVVGRFTMNGAGSLTQGAFDSVMAMGGHSRVDSFTGGMTMSSATGGPSNGRGTMTLTIPGMATVNAVIYMVNAGELFFLSADPVNANAPLLSGSILKQSPPPFMTSSLNGPAVFHATGLHASMGSNTIMIGQWVANPNSATLTAEYAGNDSGNSIPLGNFTATYSIAVNGRANLIPSSGGVPGFYYYLVGPNKAFLVSDDQNVMTGMVEPQTIPTGGLTNTSILGDYFLGTIDRASSQVIDASGVENLDGVNTWTSMEDASLPGGNYGDLGAAGTYSMTNPATGRGTITVPGGNGIVFYAVSPGKFYNFVLDMPDRIAVSEQQ
ncbi:MAG: Ig-like domain-containing protein [Acidobacteriia bacterium]|nr:Ig-like domain-containing protein [Terriglobia bacterium]